MGLLSWKETTAHEIGGRDGEPIEVVDTSPRDLARAILSVLSTARLHDGTGLIASLGSDDL